MTPHRSPRPLGAALARVRSSAQPQTLLAAVQSAWPAACGAPVAAQAQPVAERDGVVTISCHSATWAQELSLLQSELLQGLEQALSASGEGAVFKPLLGLRFTADAARHCSP